VLLDEVVVLLDKSQAPDQENSIRLVGEVWHLRYEGESGEYPSKGNQCLMWWAKLLASPNRSFSVADLRGDPEGKVAADATIGADRETEAEAILCFERRLKEIENGLKDIEEVRTVAGGSDGLDNRQLQLEREKEDLLKCLQNADYGKKIRSSLIAAHHNIATQLRNFAKKLAGEQQPGGREKPVAIMPKLAAHLNQAIERAFPDFCYKPPIGTPTWKT
jgi:hypothetical protein